MTAPQDERIAELQRANAALIAERDAVLAREAALAEVLEVINGTPGDVGPVFTAVLERAMRLCGAGFGLAYRWDGNHFHLAAALGVPPELAAFRRTGPVAVEPGSSADRLLKSLGPVNIADFRDEATYRNGTASGRAVADIGGARSTLLVPLLRDGAVIGMITVFRQEVRPFAAADIALMESFAAQAAIAMESARLLGELRARTDDLQESLDYQTATSDVLAVINRSALDLQPVLTTLVEAAARLCVSEGAAIWRYEDGYLSFGALFPPERVAEAANLQSLGRVAIDPASPSALARSVLDGRVVHLEDVSNIAGYDAGIAARNGQRTTLGVPLLRDGTAIGTMVLWRRRVEPFTERQIELVKTFANQAVIAIENTRLLTEQQEALERQTATAEILAVINANPGNLAPVFHAMLERAMRLCGAAFGMLRGFDGQNAGTLATFGVPAAYAEYTAGRAWTPMRAGPLAEALASRRTVQLLDVREMPGYRDHPAALALTELGGARTILFVPLVKDGASIGLFAIYRQEVRGFVEKEIALLESFAAQAVIAMENARLLTEQREALERQTATAEVLEAINANPGNLAPVFDAMLEKAMTLCGVAFGILRRFDGEQLHILATLGVPTAYVEFMDGRPTTPLGGLAETLATGRPLMRLDLRDSELYQAGQADVRALADLGGARTVLSVPLVKDQESVGLFTFFRQEVRPFTDKQIALLESFAAQAVIAMENARLLTEQREALERQTATAEVLGVINANPGNLAPVFDVVLENAMRLCQSAFGILRTYDGGRVHGIATRGVPEALAAFSNTSPFVPIGKMRRVLETGQSDQDIDLREDEGYRTGAMQAMVAIVDLGGARTVLQVPLIKDRTSIGLLTFFRQEVRAFTDKQIALLESFAAQAVIAMENARLLTEQREALERQTATAEVLAVINANPGNVVPVFQTMLDRALQLCGASIGELGVVDGDSYNFLAVSGMSEEFATARLNVRMLPGGPGTTFARVLAGENVIQTPDLTATEAYTSGDPSRRALVDIGGVRAQLVVALRKDQAALGAIGIYRRDPGPFTDKQISLLESFAAQAVIAMENARLLTEQQEALERQTAMAEVLQVINTAQGDLTPVFDAILEKAHLLCGASIGSLMRYDGALFHAAATRGFPPSAEAVMQHPIPPTARHRELMDGGRFVHVTDLAGDPGAGSGVTQALLADTGVRTLLLVPLRQDDAFLGFISAFRDGVRPFAEREIALLESFAAQAVIAMENARLLTETREALEQQTATAEVLAVINANPGNLAPVFDTILEKAMRLCSAAFGLMAVADGERMRYVANKGIPASLAAFRAANPMVGSPEGPMARLRQTRRAVHIDDWRDEDIFKSGIPGAIALAEMGGARTVVLVPLCKDADVSGAITIYRQEVRAFSAKEIALLENFAAQAVIAMENARLLTEQREALERQTATAEILAVINANPGNLAPVFDVILEKAMRLCGAAFGRLIRRDGDMVHGLAARGLPPALAVWDAANRSRRVGPNARVLYETRRPIQMPDIQDTEEYRSGNASVRAIVELGGGRTNLMVPLLKDETVLGYFHIYRQEVRPFADKEISLLESFAAQAVIAMENARLLTELREALERQTATAEVLEVINANPGNLAPVFDAMLQNALRLCRAASGMLYTYDGLRFALAASSGVSEAMVEHWRRNPQPTTPDSPPGQVLVTRRPVQVVDVLTHPFFLANLDLSVPQLDIGGGGRRSVLNVPLLKDNAVVGLFVIYRLEPGVWPDKQVALLENFAAQAVIAMENARLLTEQQEALERQTATAEILAVINANPGNLAPVFEAILAKAHALCGADRGCLFLHDGMNIAGVAMHGYDEEFVAMLRQPSPAAENGAARALLAGARYVQSEDIRARTGPPTGAISAGLRYRSDVRTSLVIPLRKDGVLLGVMSANRTEVRPYKEAEIAVLESFAAQAVIAMENARLLSELRVRDEDNRRLIARQAASIEILRTISENPDDPQPVFETIVRQAQSLCGGKVASVAEFDGELLHMRAIAGADAETRERVMGQYPTPPRPELLVGRVVLTGEAIHIRDTQTDPRMSAFNQTIATQNDFRTSLTLPLLREGRPVGGMAMTRREAGGFTDDEVAMLQSFAEQAVIAIAGARAQRELRVRDEDNRRLIARQSASIEILKTISASPDDPQPVFEMIARRARELCGAEAASVSEFDGNLHHMRVMIGHDAEAVARLMASFPRALEKTTLHGATILAGEVLHIRDYASDQAFKAASSLQLGNAASGVGVPLRSDGRVIGAIGLSRGELGGFDDEAVALVESFAEQAVIAISSAKALHALRARTDELAQSQEELSVTFENMNDGVALFDEHHRLVAWNSNFLRILDLPEGTLSQGLAFADYIRILAQRGEYGADANADEQVRRVLALAGQRRAFERSRPDGRTVEVRNNPVGDGGFVVIYADITERKRAEAEIAAARDAAEQATRTIEAAYRDLKIAQANLIQAEKMASLGQLTAGIAHEIKNPLNFVNNFSDLSVELLGELTEAIAPTLAGLDADTRADVEDITATLTSNLQKITQHGKRADGIVRAMLEHSRGSSGERRAVDLNAEVEEALNLAFHGARAQNQGFNITLERDYAQGMAPIMLTPQDITRVFLNLFNNGFYAATKRKAEGEPGFAPTLKVTTRDLGDAVEIRVRDNGTGIPPEICNKLFQPFFTTKPTGEGTGLGLSISYDVVTKQHGGSITVDSAPGMFTEFTVTLPRTTQGTVA